MSFFSLIKTIINNKYIMDIQKLHNKKIDIFGSKYTIKIVDKIEDEDGYYLGTTYHNKRIIELARYTNNVKISNNEIIETLLHEINHAILNTGQYLNLSHDEPLIEWLARCYYSILFNQKIFKDYD